MKAAGKERAYEIPADTDITALIRMLAQPAPERVATLRVRPGKAMPLVRRGTQSRSAGEWVVVDLPFEDVQQLASDVTAFGASVVVDSPDDLRAAVVARLAGALDAVKEQV